MVVLDTNHFSELTLSSVLGRNLALRMEGVDVFSCIVAAEESLQGWISYVAKHKAGDAQFYPYLRLQAAIEALNKFAIVPFDRDAIAIWATRFEQLKSYKERIGHCRVPTRWKENAQLGGWVASHRHLMKRRTLSPEKERLLREIGLESEK